MCYYFKVKKTINKVDELADFALDFIGKLPPKGSVAGVVGLSGELGAGKTTFTKEVAKILGIKENLSSPTFVLMKKYKIPYLIPDTLYRFLVHIDAYRIEDPDELVRLGWEKIISDPNNLVFVEWPEKIESIMPKHLCVSFIHRGENKRDVSIKKK